MQYNLNFDYAAFILYFISFISVFYRKTYKTISGKFFLALSLLLLTTTLMDILSVTPAVGHNWMWITNTAYIILRNINIIFYFIYLIVVTDTVHILLKRKWLLVLYAIPHLVLLVFVFLNIKTEWIFSVDGTTYVRHGLMTLMYLVAVFYMILSMVYLLIYRKTLPMNKFISAFMIYPLTVFSILFQSFSGTNVLMEMFMSALSLLIVAFTIEVPEEYLEYDTGYKGYKGFVADGNKATITKKPSALALFVIINDKSVRTMLDHSGIIIYKKYIAGVINTVFKENNLLADKYSFNDGRFVIVLKQYNSESLNKVAEEIRTRLNVEYKSSHGIVTLLTNAYTILVPDDVKGINEILDTINKFSANENYLNNLQIYSEMKNERAKYELGSIIEEAFDHQYFHVYYQPIYSIRNGKFESAEALCRLIHPTYGFISPGQFIPYAEKNGLIVRIGDYVLEEVFRFIGSTDMRTLGVKYIEINLSIVQCIQDDLVGKITALAEKYNVKPSQVNFEITETFDSVSSGIIKRNLSELRKLGYTIALDDYGTGFSNIERVVSLPLSIIKLDKSFVDTCTIPKMKLVIEDTIFMIKHLKLDIVVEGIETEENVMLFREYGCDYIQGYYFSKPLPEEKYIEFLENN